MVVTSAEANKELRRYNDELNRLLINERQSALFVASTTEDVETARPEYFFADMQEKIEGLQKQIRTIKHAINQFNVTHCPDGFDMTVDEMLVYIPQLTAAKSKYQTMVNRLPKSRKENGLNRSAIIEYEYANYDIELARAKLDEVTTELARAQIALDRLNTSVTFEIQF